MLSRLRHAWNRFRKGFTREEQTEQDRINGYNPYIEEGQQEIMLSQVIEIDPEVLRQAEEARLVEMELERRRAEADRVFTPRSVAVRNFTEQIVTPDHPRPNPSSPSAVIYTGEESDSERRSCFRCVHCRETRFVTNGTNYCEKRQEEIIDMEMNNYCTFKEKWDW